MSTPPVVFPQQGLVLRGRSSNSVALWIVCTLAVVVVTSDLVVGIQWLFTGQPHSPAFVFAGIALTLSTLLLAATIVLTTFGVRRQRYAVGPYGLKLGAARRDPVVAWHEVQTISRRYQKAPGGGTMGVAVFVDEPERYASIRNAADNVREYGTPVYLDLTDVSGGTLRFFAAVRWYAASAGRRDLVLD